MRRSAKYTISLVLAALAWGPIGRAEAQGPAKRGAPGESGEGKGDGTGKGDGSGRGKGGGTGQPGKGGGAGKAGAGQAGAGKAGAATGAKPAAGQARAARAAKPSSGPAAAPPPASPSSSPGAQPATPASSAPPAVPPATPSPASASPSSLSSPAPSAPAAPAAPATPAAPPSAAPRSTTPPAPGAASSATELAPASAAAPAAPAAGELTLEEAVALSEEEVVEVWDERPDKPFDRDTKLRITGQELAERGVTDLGQAIAVLTDVQVREAGRGGFNVDIRGARKGAVRILVDGISVSDPYYGTFDVSTIPVTDIEQIRVSTSPSSPIDGPGGPGGVVEVHTRDAIGAQLIRARVTTDTGPTFGVSGSARAALGEHTAVRLSMSGTAGARDFDLPDDAAMPSVDESRRVASGAGRLEYRRGDRRVVLDVGFDDRHYLSPPADEKLASILLIDRETTLRSLVGVEDKIGKLQVQGRAWADRMRRESRYFRDATFAEQTAAEDLSAMRVGGQALATRPIGRAMRWAASATVDRDAAEVDTGGPARAKGDAVVSELAGDLQYEGKGFLVDGAVGVALPFGIDADPWLEGKLDARYKPIQGLELAAILAQKGRTPSLRERFDPISGNEELDPELARHAELRLTAEHRTERWGVQLEAAPFYRRSTGTVRLEPKFGRMINLGELEVKGVDTRLEASLAEGLEAGAAYSYVTAYSDTAGEDPLDRLPNHRYDLWLKISPLGRRLSALGRFRYIGRRLDQGTTLGAYTTVEASLTSQLSEAYLAVLRVEDLLDAAPEVRSGYHSEGRLFSVMLQGTWQ